MESFVPRPRQRSKANAARRALKNWHLSMSENFKRQAVLTVERGYPATASYFESKARQHDRAASDIKPLVKFVRRRDDDDDDEPEYGF